MSGHNYNFDEGDLILHYGQVKIIMERRNGEYYMKKGEGGNLKWVDSIRVDIEAEPYDE